MSRCFFVVRVLLALFVAVLLPLEQARCACRMAEKAAASASHGCCAKRVAAVANASSHACCAARAGAPSKSAPASRDCGGTCSCYHAPAESAPATTLAPASEAPTLSPLAAIAVCAALAAPASTHAVAAPPPDIGGPPLDRAALAHALRGPPVTR